MPNRFAIADPEGVPTGTFDTCDVSVRKLTERLGCTEMRVDHVIVEPGEATTPHTHEGQEEVFVPLSDGLLPDRCFETSRRGPPR